jgi:catechol 2,3-dioxygenase-like lactoylglutathione lyase family enzyme
MPIPRILALTDVNMASLPQQAEQVVAFYTQLVGLDHLPEESDQHRKVFRGDRRRGPRIVVRLRSPLGEEDRRRVLIQVASLRDYVERLTEQRVFWQEIRGWGYYDRRLYVFDPAGNLVELVCYHLL